VKMDLMIWAETTIEVSHTVNYPITKYGKKGGYDMHGHSYWIKGFIRSYFPQPTTETKKRVDPPSVEKLSIDMKRIAKKIDHKCLNMTVQCGTMEGLAKYFFNELKKRKYTPLKIQIERKSMGVGLEYTNVSD
jgi:6-pyruvoyl-tetrahydropterin synthase